MQMHIELYLSSKPCEPQPPGGELVYAGRFPSPLGPGTGLRDIGQHDEEAIARIVTRFHENQPAGYAGHTLSPGDVITLVEGRWSRSHMLLGRGNNVLQLSVTGAHPVAELLTGSPAVADMERARFTARLGQYDVSILLAHGRLAPKV